MLKIPDQTVTGERQSASWHPRRWLQFLRLVGLDIGETKRIGWSAIGFSHNEQDSVGEHEYNLSLCSFLFNLHLKIEGIANLDGEKMISMPDHHDNTELRGGDIGTPRGQDYPELKIASREIELIAQAEFCELLKNDCVAQGYKKLVEEERDQTTDEAKVVKVLDRLEAWLHLQKKDPSPWCDAHENYFKNTIRKNADTIANDKLRIATHKLIDSFIRLHQQGRLGRKRPEIRDSDTAEDRLVVLCDEFQLAKAITRTSWVAAGLRAFELDTIAQHGHAGLTVPWLIGEVAKERKLKYNTEEALSAALLRDLGKLYGGDVSVASTSSDDPMRKASRKIRQTAFKIIVSKLRNDEMQSELSKSHDAAMLQETDMSCSQMAGARVMDLMFYDGARRPNYNKKRTGKFFDRYAKLKIMPLIEKISDPSLRTLHEDLFGAWTDLIRRKQIRQPLHKILGKEACLK